LETTGGGWVPRITHGAKLPVSNPPFVMAPDAQGVNVGEGVIVAVFVGVLVGGVPVTVGVGVPPKVPRTI